MTSTTSRRVTAVVLLAAMTATALAGCGGVGARLTFNDTEAVKVTEIVLTGTSGNVNVKTAPIDETRINRIIHRNSDPAKTYRIDGTVLYIDTDCGQNCSVTYDIEAPAGVAVRGDLSSGDISLASVSTVDVTVSSGDVVVRGSTGAVRAKTTSGDVEVYNTKGATTIETTSGNVRALNVGGGAVNARATSGDVEVRMTTPNSVTATATSGDVDVSVPAGDYRIETDTGSGEDRIIGLVHDPAAKNVITAGTRSGDTTISAAPAA